MNYKLYKLDNELAYINSNKIPKNFTGIVEYWNRTKEWWFHGELHRLDGPAVEYNNGIKEYYLNNKCIGSREQHSLLVDLMKLKGLL